MLRKFKPLESVKFLLSDGETDGETGGEADGEIAEAGFRGACSVLELALENAIELSHSCGGMGTCGTCRVILVDPPEDIEERNELELEMAQDRNFEKNERLACQLMARNGLKIRIP